MEPWQATDGCDPLTTGPGCRPQALESSWPERRRRRRGKAHARILLLLLLLPLYTLSCLHRPPARLTLPTQLPPPASPVSHSRTLRHPTTLLSCCCPANHHCHLPPLMGSGPQHNFCFKRVPHQHGEHEICIAVEERGEDTVTGVYKLN